jgi:hypothetical protein
MKFKFTPPKDRYDLTQIILGHASGETVALTEIASSTSIGTFPDWISEYTYSASSGAYYYSIKWDYTNGGQSSWSSPRMRGRTGIETDYILVNAPTASSVYIMKPVSGDVTSLSTSFLDYNKIYTITIDKTLSGQFSLPMVADYTFEFTSAFCPAFASVNDIRYEVGDFINNVTDDTINRIIFKNSSYIVNKFYRTVGGMPASYTCEGVFMNTAFKSYVVCKSAFDTITSVQLSTGGRTVKKLADVTFEYAGSNSKSDPQNKKQELKECIDSALSVIFAGQNFQMAVKGRYFAPLPHPMHDSTFGRLSLPNKDYNFNWQSKFDEVVGIENSGTGVKHT